MAETIKAWQAEYLASIVDSTDDAVIGKTLDGTIISWNRAAERIYGYTAEEVIGRPIAILVPPENPDELPAIMARLAMGERIEHHRTTRVRKDGQRITVSVTISPVRDEAGRVVGGSAIARDVTAEEAATREALRLREEFISVAAHELRTPLSTLYARLQLVERRVARGLDREQIARDLGLVREAADRLRRLLERLLDLSRISSGRLALERADADVAALVRSTADAMAEASERRVVVHAPDSAHASVDALRLDEVLVNLIDNAIKYGGSQAPIDIDVETEDAAIIIAVRDRGPGIPAKETEELFEPFARGATRVPGVGLGLHVARQIVEMHGGSLLVERPPDGGSRFVVRLPKNGSGGNGAKA